MEFSLSEEQKLIIDTTKKFVETELFPHEELVEKTGNLPLDLIKEIQLKAINTGIYAANIPQEYGGAGLDTLTWLLMKKSWEKQIMHYIGLVSPDLQTSYVLEQMNKRKNT